MTSHFSLVRGTDPASGLSNPGAPTIPDAPPSTHATLLIESKLAAPRPMGPLIERPELLELFSQAARGKLVVIAAPGGYGKSTLLAQWHASAASAAAIAWLSLDAQDSEPGRFFRYLSAAIESFGVAAQRNWPPSANSIIASLGQLTQPLHIVLDDFDQLCDHRLVQDIAFVIRRSPPCVHWIVAGRCIPELDLTQHKLHDDLTLIDAAALSFSSADTAALAAQLCSMKLALPDVEVIHAATEGWAAGIKLTLLTHESDGASIPNARVSVGANVSNGARLSNADVAHYLTAAILHRQSPQVRELLLATSIVDRINGELCNALLGVADGTALVAGLEKSQLFIQAADGQGHWYRYHRLFLQFLRACLQRDYSERVAELHRRASQWYAQQQMSEEALEHAFASGDRAWCVELIARCARSWLKVGELGRILHWVGQLTRSESLHHELIGPIFITCLVWRRRFKEAAAALHETRNALLAIGEETAVTSARMRTLQLMLNIHSGDTDDIDVSEDLPADGRTDTYLMGTLMTLRAYWLLGRCRFDLARRQALRAREIMKQHDSLFALNYVDGVIALADCAQGDIVSAAAGVERMFAAVSDVRGPAWTNAAASLARMRYEQNRLPEAEQLCTELLPLLSSAGTVEDFTVVHILLARIKASQGRFVESFKLLDYLHSVLENDGHQGVLANVCCEKIRLHLRCQDRDRAVAVAVESLLAQRVARGEWLQPRDYSMAWEQLGLAHAALLLEDGQHEACRKVLHTLLASTYLVGFIARAVTLEAALAVCDWRAGEQVSAFAALNRGLLLTRKIGFTRCSFDEAPGLADVISAAAETRRLQHPLPARYCEKFQDLFAAANTDRAAVRSLPLEPLTLREVTILVLLAQGLSNQEISIRSRIALSTTKWHLKNVFAKLAVSTRTSALARAKELNLIE